MEQTRSIQSLDEAFARLEAEEYGIPFGAIEYLYKHPQDDRIDEKIIWHLENAHNDDLFYSEEKDWTFGTPLWYAIVAEGHLSEKLTEPLFKFFQQDQDWDFIMEQTGYLVGKMAQKFPDTFIPKAIDHIELEVLAESDAPFNFFFEVFLFCDLNKYKSRIIRLLKNPRLRVLDALVSEIGALPIPELIPIFEELKTEYEARYEKEQNFHNEHALIELEEALKIQKGELEWEERQAYCEMRGHWKSHYHVMDDRFYPDEQVNKYEYDYDEEDDNDYEEEYEKYPLPQTTVKREGKKIGRNDPCPCGSGKKYKKCCMP